MSTAWRPVRKALMVMISVVVLALVSLSTSVRAQSSPSPRGDLGDAPDSTNHTTGDTMNAYADNPAIQARFPTVFDGALPGPQGPLHHNEQSVFWLGTTISKEYDADQLPDEDPLTGWPVPHSRNIVPDPGFANREVADDGLPMQPIHLPRCEQTTFSYDVSRVWEKGEHIGYVNVWFDFNRDGDWGDTLSCNRGDGLHPVPEWAVVNQKFALAPGLNTITTPQFYSAHINQHEARLWMRITLTDVALSADRHDGSGPASGYRLGETEDYVLNPVLAPSPAQQRASMTHHDTLYQPEYPDASYLPGY